MYKANRAIINESETARRAADVYDAGGPDALRDFLRGLVRSWKINPAEATHIYCWTDPDCFPSAGQRPEAKA